MTLLRSDFRGRFDEFFGRDGFTRVPALPPETIHEPSLDKRFRDPTFVFDLVWHHFDEQFPFFEIRGFDWSERYRRYRPNISRRSTDEELYDALTGMLAGLGDSHTRIYWEEREQPFKSGRARVLDYLEAAFERQDQYGDQSEFNGFWDRTGKARVASELVDGQLRESANVIGWGHLEGDVGYIRLDFLTGFGQPGSSKEEQVELLEREMDRIIEEFQDRRAIIIDLSFNQGGFDPAGAVIASRFADRRRHVLSTYSAGQDPGSAREFSVSPGGPRQYTGPVYVLTSNITVSAGETLTLMLKAFPHVRHLGEPTRGCLSSFLNKGMPNAFHVTMSNQFWVSPGGRIYEGSGIKPDVEFPVFSEEDLFDSYPEAVQRALMIATQSRR